MRLFQQFIQFETITATSVIALPVLLTYYGILTAIYLLFLRGLKPTVLTITIFTIFNAGYFESFFGGTGTAVLKGLLVLFVFMLLIQIKLRNLNKKERMAFFMFVAFSILYYLNYIVNEVSLIWATLQYFKYFFPIMLYYAIRGLNLDAGQTEYYGDLILKLFKFQIVFSVVKLFVLGFRENIVGTITNTGGSVGLVYAIFGIIIFWAKQGSQFKRKDWWFVFLLLLLPIASNKRATWFIVPALLAILMIGELSRNSVRNVAMAFILVPVLVYFGFRLNPSLNPETKLWGSFDFEYAWNYSLNYSGVSEEKMESDYAQGRWGASLQIYRTTMVNPFSMEALLGWGRSRRGTISEDFDPLEYGLLPGTMMSGIGSSIIKNGWPATFLLILIYLNLIATIPDKKARLAFSFYLFWDMILYSGALINSHIRATIFILAIWLVRFYVSKDLESAKVKNVSMVTGQRMIPISSMGRVKTPT